MIRVAAQLVPAAQRPEWKQEWCAEVWHRWQFLLHAGEWNRREGWRLFRGCLGVFADAGWYAVTQTELRNWIREWARSPWICVGAWTALIAVVAIGSGGFPATRQLLFGQHAERSNLLLLWLHPEGGYIEKGLPPDVAPAWRRHSRYLQQVAAFTASHVPVSGLELKPLVVRTEPSLFAIFHTRPALGAIPEGGSESGVLLDHRAWQTMFHADSKIIGTFIKVAGEPYRVRAVLPANFQFLSRQASVYVVMPVLADPQVMVIARIKSGASRDAITKELTKIAEDSCYYFLGPDLRLEFLEGAVFTPLRFFGIAVGIALLMLLGFSSRVRLRHLRMAWEARYREATIRRCLFFAMKTGLAWAFVFTAGLEWSRPEGSFLFASKDPANGPFLVWLYILGAMGVLFWSVADQRARCRVCLRLLCFPVRIGCPGCLLLDWSGTESVCAEGHGVLHVPHLAPSWDEEVEHWIALDESWQELFAGSK